jgi:moderate conductance mechanosensitive channel
MLKFAVPFDTDPEKLRGVFKWIGQDMPQDPVLANSFIAPFKSQGMKDFNDTVMVERGKFTFKPGTQCAIRKELHHRVQKESAANGIGVASKEVRVLMGGC